MGVKKLVNNTEYDVVVTLVVRQGETVGTTAAEVVVNVSANSSKYGEWASPLGPYLDAVLVEVPDRPDLWQPSARVAHRDDGVDAEINTQDMVVLDMDAQGVVMSFRNSRPARRR